MSRGLQAEETAPERANPDPKRPESTVEPASPRAEDQRLTTGGYRVSLPMFEGPLDLLLHLVQKHELDILNIPIAFITERYVEYIQLLDELNIDLASEYLVMAATLLHIKSRMLLPSAPEDESSDGTEEDELDPRAELVRRLLEYQKYKKAAEELGERAILGRDVFPRGSSNELAAGEAPLEAIATFKLLDAFQAVLERTQKTREHQIDFERFSLSEKISELSDLLRRRRRLVFHEIFRERASRAELIITFLALLEMTRLRLTRLRQEGPFEPIYIELRVTDEELPPEELPPEAEAADDEAANAALAADDEPPTEAAVAADEVPMAGDASAAERALAADDQPADSPEPAADAILAADDEPPADDEPLAAALAADDTPVAELVPIAADEPPAPAFTPDDGAEATDLSLKADAAADAAILAEAAEGADPAGDVTLADAARPTEGVPTNEALTEEALVEDDASSDGALNDAALADDALADDALADDALADDVALVDDAALAPEVAPTGDAGTPPEVDSAVSEGDGALSGTTPDQTVAAPGAKELITGADEPARPDLPAESPAAGHESAPDAPMSTDDSRSIGSPAPAAVAARETPEELAPAAGENEPHAAADPREYE